MGPANSWEFTPSSLDEDQDDHRRSRERWKSAQLGLSSLSSLLPDLLQASGRWAGGWGGWGVSVDCLELFLASQAQGT